MTAYIDETLLWCIIAMESFFWCVTIAKFYSYVKRHSEIAKAKSYFKKVRKAYR